MCNSNKMFSNTQVSIPEFELFQFGDIKVCASGCGLTCDSVIFKLFYLNHAA